MAWDRVGFFTTRLNGLFVYVHHTQSHLIVHCMRALAKTCTQKIYTDTIKCWRWIVFLILVLICSSVLFRNSHTKNKLKIVQSFECFSIDRFTSCWLDLSLLNSKYNARTIAKLHQIIHSHFHLWPIQYLWLLYTQSTTAVFCYCVRVFFCLVWLIQFQLKQWQWICMNQKKQISRFVFKSLGVRFAYIVHEPLFSSPQTGFDGPSHDSQQETTPTGEKKTQSTTHRRSEKKLAARWWHTNRF